MSRLDFLIAAQEKGESCCLSELEPGYEFDLTACVSALRVTKVLVLDVCAGVGISIGDGQELQFVEGVVKIRLKAQRGVMIKWIERKLLRYTHIDIEVAGSLETIAPNAWPVGEAWRQRGREVVSSTRIGSRPIRKI
jgi:hypothetical protein